MADKTLWPKDDVKSLSAFYGTHKLDDQGRPTASWESRCLSTRELPYPMELYVKGGPRVKRFTANRLVMPSLIRIFNKILKFYGNYENLAAHRMNIYGGCYNYRPTRGGSRLSVHSWGAAIDIDPENNPLGKKWKNNSGMIPVEVIEIFKEEGWVWGGDWTKPDCMHFQATT